MNQPRMTSKDSGSETFAATSFYLEGTQWPSIYQNARRDILRALARLPNRQSLTTDYILEQIWNHSVWDLFDTSKGLWPGMESESYGGIGETLDAPISDRSDRDTCDVLQDGEGIHGDRQEEEEDDGVDDVEGWGLEDDEDDYDDSGYDSDLIGTNKEPYSEPFIRVEGKSTKPAFDEFLELLMQLCLTLCTETFIDGLLRSIV
ncbi:hypothetical protein NCS52_01522300 [Fusarium sp. LHS14.1]|nr:hypothetical protein NCS52_01522300 [Fusarium sp. LHS14.1]